MVISHWWNVHTSQLAFEWQHAIVVVMMVMVKMLMMIVMALVVWHCGWGACVAPPGCGLTIGITGPLAPTRANLCVIMMMMVMMMMVIAYICALEQLLSLKWKAMIVNSVCALGQDSNQRNQSNLVYFQLSSFTKAAASISIFLQIQSYQQNKSEICNVIGNE